MELSIKEASDKPAKTLQRVSGRIRVRAANNNEAWSVAADRFRLLKRSELAVLCT